jgi:alpha-amylase
MPLGTDDTGRTAYSTTSAPSLMGTKVTYRAVVRDNAGHQRVSGSQNAVVPAPKLTIEAPAEGAEVFGTIEARVAADPERASHVVRIQRKLPSDSDWVTASNPSYT